VRLLLEHGADPRIRNRNRDTAADLATANRHAAITELLKKYRRQRKKILGLF